MRYRPEMDGFRALVVVPVILFHAGFELFSGGFNVMEVALVTGHQDLRMLKRYTHLKPESLVSRLG